MQFKQYPSYKDSGVEWLGEVPEHWDVKRLKYLFSIKNGATPKSNVSQFWDGDIKWVTPSDLSKLESHEIAESSRTITVEGFNSCGTNLVPAGSIIVSCRAPIGSLAITLTSLCTNQGCKSLVASKILNIKFYFYFLSISADKLNSLGNGTTFLELSAFELKNLSILAPRTEEQNQIVSFLDTETARIDTLIAKQEKLIELLEEQRKSIISHAVTKGLDPNAPMKDSGVEWLGEVPEHWEIMQLKSAIKNWRNGKWGNDVGTNKNDNLICVRVADFNRDKGVIDTEKLTYRNYTGETIGSCLLNKNHILIERSGGGENQLVGATVRFTLSEISVCSNFISLLEIKTESFDLRFIQYSFEHLYNLNVNKLSIKQTSGIQNLDLKQYVQNSFSFPHLLEQQKIVSYLDSETTRIDNLIAKQEKLIELLEEQRKSIISHAVTGKIDVREYAE